ncbi:MAG: hybrid sensor histidine kinase/response regulator, partial [Bacteroidota bacterium]
MNDQPLLLIADDEPQNLQAIISILNASETKYRFLTVPNGKLLADLATKKLPDLIITDWDMPEMNGLEAVAELKENSATAHIPVIMCTGVMTSPKDLKLALQAGASDYIRKPVEAIELLARINSMLELSASYSQIFQQKEELEKLNTLKNKMLSILSHDLRSPLNSLKGILHLFEHNALSESELKEYFSKVDVQVGNVTEFLGNLLIWSKNQLQGTKVVPKRVSIAAIVSETIQLLEPMAHAKEIKIQADKLNDCSLMADNEALKIVIRNIVSNAIKFSHKSGVIEITSDVKDDEVTIYIQDSGVGISAEHLELLFTTEGNISRGTSQEAGTGLGLMLSKQLIESHNGKIGVESTVG